VFWSARAGESSHAKRHVYLAWFLLHGLLIITISSREIFWLIAHRLTILPTSFSSTARKLESIASTALAQNLASSNPVRRAFLTYLHVAGIERGYGYFAPNVPGSYKLVFELHYPDGTVEYELPEVRSTAAELRLASLLDEIGRTRNDALREYLVKTLAGPVWREHPEAKTIRAIFGLRNFPDIHEFQRGARESYEFLYAYDFSLMRDPPQPKNP
jgi:hypothetical protein